MVLSRYGIKATLLDGAERIPRFTTGAEIEAAKFLKARPTAAQTGEKRINIYGTFPDAAEHLFPSQNQVSKLSSVGFGSKNRVKSSANRYLISCFCLAAAYCRPLPISQETPEKPCFSTGKRDDFVTTDQQVIGSTPIGCTTTATTYDGCSPHHPQR
jgi:hypothetical protein